MLYFYLKIFYLDKRMDFDEMPNYATNSVDPDEMPHNAAFHLVKVPVLGFPRIQRGVKSSFTLMDYPILDHELLIDT